MSSIGDLRRQHQLNLLSIEALAAARRLDAHVFLSASSPRLEAALRTEGLDVRVLPPAEHPPRRRR